MRSIITLCMVLFMGPFLFAQIKFERGSILKNNGDRVEVLIRNSSSIQNNGKLVYKISEESETKEATPSEIKEFQIGDNIKFLTRTVQIDKSWKKGKEIEENSAPNYKKKTVFLQVLIEGEASLYLYSGRKNHFYFQTNSTPLTPLVYKKYLKGENKIAENNKYKIQLYEALKCKNDLSLDLQNARYKIRDLIEVFIDYNNCKKTDYSNYFQRDNKFKFNLSIRPGVNLSTFKLNFGNRSSSREFSEVASTEPRIGAEAEFILPFNRNKWAFFLEPAFQRFSYEEERYDQEVRVNFSSIEIPVGIRHYLFLNDESKFYLNAAFMPMINIKSEVYLQYYDDIGLSDKPYFFGGLGFKYKDKYSAEFRVGSKRDIIEDRETRWFSDFQTISFIVGYTIF